jgi:hypothetical protein
MDTNKNISDSLLHELFSRVPIDEPSPDFMERMLRRIEKEALREKRKQQWMLVGQIAAGLSGIFILPALAIYLCTIFFSDYSFSFSFPEIHMNFDPNLVTIGFSVLLLLIIDTLFRKQIANRTKRDS